MKLLILNAGSSSQKSCLYELGASLPDHPPEPLWEAQIDWSHPSDGAELEIQTSQEAACKTELAGLSRAEAIHQMLTTLWEGSTAVLQQPQEIEGVAHRVVHGGQAYQTSTRITPAVKAAIADLEKLAPAHNPANLEGIEVAEQLLGAAVPQVAVFDTAFHAQMPAAAAIYPGPYEWSEQGIRRYGFHGISHQYCAHRAAHLLGRDLPSLRLISCHLGNGCSLAAIHNGCSIDTTMGLTPLEGLMMGSRCGSIDPGLLIHLLRQQHYTLDQLDHLLNQESGLKGISGLSADMRQIQTAIAEGNPRAQLALDIYIHRLRAGIGAMLASLGGLDALIFTAGVGENTSQVRAAACEAFAFLGLRLDPEKNTAHPIDQDIATADSRVRVLVIHTQEDWAIAREAWQSLQDEATHP
jgi:acetate kinase